MGASKTQKTSKRKTEASQKGSRVEKAAPERVDLADNAVRSIETRKVAEGNGKRQEGLVEKDRYGRKPRAVERKRGP